MTKLKNRKSDDKYARWKRELSPIYKFSFRNTKHFTPQQKAAITRVYNGTKTKVDYSTGEVLKRGKPGLRNVIKHIREGRAVFKPAKKSQRDNLKQGFLKTNKGILVYGYNIRGVKIKGQGKNINVYVRRDRVTDVYVPKLAGERITDTVRRVFDTYNPDTITLAVNTYTGTVPYTPGAFDAYESDLGELEDDILSDYDDSPFNGVYAEFYTN